MWNPYARLLYENLRQLGALVDEFSWERLARERYSILHLHWPDSRLGRRNPFSVLTSLQKFFAGLDNARSRGTKIIWTIHNLRSHERFHSFIESRFWRSFVPRLDGVISMSSSGLELGRAALVGLDDVPAWIIPHGSYRGVYPDSVSRNEARGRLQIPPVASVLLFFGSVRSHKNVPALARAFRKLDQQGTRLLIAGRPNLSRLAREVTEAASGDSRIGLFLNRIAEDEVQTYLRASDLVVLPYSETLNSGSALLALSFDRPLLVPRIGAFPELEAAVGAEWVRTYVGPLTPKILRGGVDWAAHENRSSTPLLDRFEWDLIARQTLEVYQHVSNPQGGEGSVAERTGR